VRQFKELLTAVGLPGTIRAHDLRHSAASALLGNGLDVKTTADILGHTQTSTTLNTYPHVLKESRADAVKRSFGDVVTAEEVD
jgi:integrase